VRSFRRRRSRLQALREHLRKSADLVVSGWDLDDIDLSGLALLGVEFHKCELASANFAGADLSLARFVDCNLYRADFAASMLYTTWFYECNLTKASFHGAFVLGLRLRNVDITKTTFDDVPLVGSERKSGRFTVDAILTVPLLGRLPGDIAAIERGYAGVAMVGCPRNVIFIREAGEDRFRTRIRTAETAKYLRAVHAENGYEARADHYYVVERRQRRLALHGTVPARLRRMQDYILGDFLWRYGSNAARPIAALLILALVASGATYAAPLAGGGTGLHPGDNGSAYSFHGWNAQSLTDYLNVLYFFLTSTVGGSQAVLTGWAKVVFVAYVFTAIWLIALIFEASTRRLGRSD
jgi:hypothetical protein